MYRRAGEIFAELKSETRPRDLVKQMSGGQRQAVAIARTRLSDPKIVLMDEPTAAISVRQVAEVLNLIRRLRDHGHSVILISHRMPDVFAVADRIAVLRRGRQGGGEEDRRFFAGGGDRPDHGRHRRRPERSRSDGERGHRMAVTLEDTIKAQTHSPLCWLLSRQTFWVFVAAVVACIALSLATNTFATPNNLFNVTRNFTFTAIIALGMTVVIITGGIDLSVGSVLVLCSMILAVVMHARLQHLCRRSAGAAILALASRRSAPSTACSSPMSACRPSW